METLIKIFGEGKELTVYQMSARAVVVYFLALILIRISGRRTFGNKTSFDNVIAIILGAMLSRAISGAAPFLSTIVCSLVLVLIHRLLASLFMRFEGFARLIKGQTIPLFKNGDIIRPNLNKALLTENDLLSDLRSKGSSNSFDDIDEMCMETTGEVSVIKKKKPASPSGSAHPNAA
jgi:uncharacterized membrane protein YcaP (DUF421 family)